MTTFSQWLDSNPNMATKLARIVGVNRTSISNCKTGYLLMPPRWMPAVVELSGGALSYAGLIADRERRRKEKLRTK